jgi:hypothetical protein
MGLDVVLTFQQLITTNFHPGFIFFRFSSKFMWSDNKIWMGVCGETSHGGAWFFYGSPS